MGYEGGMEAADLRAWRARRRLSQAEAAERLGYSRRGYQENENREGPISSKLEISVYLFDAGELAKAGAI